VISLSVCLFVCLSVHEHISGTSGPIFTKFCVQIPVAVAWSSSGVVAICYVLMVYGLRYVTFGCSGPYGDVWKTEPLIYYQ